MTPKKFDIEKFSEDVLLYRSENKLTRKKLSQLIGMENESIIRKIENNHIKPKIEVAYNLCELIGTPLNSYMK